VEKKEFFTLGDLIFYRGGRYPVRPERGECEMKKKGKIRRGRGNRPSSREVGGALYLVDEKRSENREKGQKKDYKKLSSDDNAPR